MAAFEFLCFTIIELGYQESCMTASNAFFSASLEINRVKASQCPLVSIDAIAFRASRIVRLEPVPSQRVYTIARFPLDTNMVAGINFCSFSLHPIP